MLGRAAMDFSGAFQRLFAQPHNMSWDDNLRYVPIFLPHINNCVHYIANIILTCEHLPQLQDILQTALVYL